MDTKMMNIFLKIVDYQSITRVAEEFNMTQPAVSSALKRIEEEAGCPLFTRRNKWLVLNEQGKILYDNISGMMQDINHVRNSLSLGNPHKNEIILNLKTTSDRIYRLMDLYLKQHPDVRFTLRSFMGGDDGRDPGFGLTLKLRQHVENETYIPIDMQNTLYVIMNRAHPLARREQIHFTDIVNEDFVFQRAENKTGYEQSYSDCLIEGIVPRVTLVVDSRYMKYAAIRRGEWIGMAYNHELSFGKNVQELAVIPMHAALTGKMICLAYREDGISGAEQSFAEFVRTVIREDRTWMLNS